METGFVCTDNKGFAMSFPNGIVISVQWGAMNYCSHYGEHLEPDYVLGQERRVHNWTSPDAEVLITRSGYKDHITKEVIKAIGGDPDIVDSDGCAYRVDPVTVAKAIAHCASMA